MSGRVLLVDDDVTLLETLALALRPKGFQVRTETRGEAALDALDREDFDVVLTDLAMPGLGGIELAARIAERRPDLPVVVLTAFGSFDAAVAAIRAGAYDFLSKPVKTDVLVIALERATRHRRLGEEVKRLRSEVAGGVRLDGVVAQSREMKGVLELVARVAMAPSSVLITGESGTGKEVIARAIHDRSGRRGPFVAVDCAAMPEALLESELFGLARGTSTDAKEARVGLFTAAHGGTLFLDEIGDLPIGLQPKLLRALQERKVRPVGGRSEHPVDVRIVAATKKDLESAVEEGRFREDLFFRLNVVGIGVPPLRSRVADLLPLAQFFLEQHAARAKKPVVGLSAAAAEKLANYSWPGNVRELQNCIERAVALTRFEQIGVDDLPEKIREHRPSHVVVVTDDPADLVSLDEIEKRYVLRVLEALGGNKTQAARVLRIERKTLYRKLESWGLRDKIAGSS